MDIDPSHILLTATETARLLRCSLRTLDRERSDGCGCPFVRIGARIRYRRADVEDFIAAHLRGYVTEAAASSPRRLRKGFGNKGAAP